MNLGDRQRFFARLWTDPGFRREFAADPAACGADYGLTAPEAGDVAETAWRELEYFARTLESKRRREAARLLPHLTRAAGEGFGPLFSAFAAGFTPTATNKPLEDALEFCRHIAKGSRDANVTDAELAEVARFELSRLRFLSSDASFGWFVSRYDPVSRQVGRRLVVVWRRTGAGASFSSCPVWFW